MPDRVLYSAEATSSGDGRNGRVATSDHRLDLDLALPPELGGSGNGTNPEQLFAAAYAACFHGALRSLARQAGIDVGESIVTALVPTSEILRYAIDLRSMTGGRGRFHAQHDHYDPLPQNLWGSVTRSNGS